LGGASSLARQICVYFSFFDCPFKDDATAGAPTAAENAIKDELIKSITGENRIADVANSATANSGISNWELKQPQSTIVEPTPHSYE